MAEDATSLPERRRNRDLLSAYYNISENSLDAPRTPTSASASGPASGHDQLSLDSSSFESGLYLKDVLASNGLHSLLDIQRKLASEIKTLDGSMQNLVYENYNKFISATDTIRSMKSNVDKLEGEMNQLNQNMDSITHNSDSINGALAARRSKIEQLSGIHRLVKRLHFLFELPSRLQKCIELKAYSQAVKYHNKSLGILQKYSQIESFNSILSECESIMKDLRDLLHKRLSSPDITSKELNENIQLLLELREPQEPLLEYLFTCRDASLRATLESICSKPFSKEKTEKNELVELMNLLQTSFIREYIELAENFMQMIISEDQETAQKFDDKFIDFTDGIFGYMNNLIAPKILEFNGDGIKLLAGLEVLLSGLRHVQNSVPASFVYESAVSLVQTAIKSAVDRSLESVNQKTMDIVRALGSQLQLNSREPLSHQIVDTVRSITNEIQSTLVQLKPLFTSNSDIMGPHQSTLIVQLFVGMQKMFLTIGEDLLGYALPNGNKLRLEKDQKPPLIALVLSRICLSIHDSEISASIKYLKGLLPEDLEEYIREHVDNFNEDALREHMHSTAASLLELYIDREALRLSQIIRKNIAAPNWLNYKEPREVRMAIDMVVTEIQNASVDVNRVYTDVRRAGSVSSSKKSSNRSRYTRGGQADGIWKARVEIFGAVEFTADSIMTGIVKAGLKSFVECVRLRTFNKFGLHQMQVDMSFLKQRLYKIISDKEVIDTLSYEVLSSVAARCTEPVSLESAIIDNIISKKRDPAF